MSNNINYSVIIPFKDCTKDLERACLSVPDRQDIQILVIDNASSPIGETVVNNFGRCNVQYFTSSPEKGAGCARNVGLEHAEGKFLLFLDADDVFTENAFLHFDMYLESGYDIVFFNATSIQSGTGFPSTRHKEIDRIIKKSIKTFNEDELRYRFVNPVAKMISRVLVENNGIRFQEVPAGNDQMFSAWTGYYAGKVKAVDDIVYIITESVGGNSLTGKKNLVNQESRFYVAVDHYMFMRSIGRLDMAYRIISFILHGYLDFGFKVGNKWLKYAYICKVDFFAL